MTSVETYWGKHKVLLEWVPATTIPEGVTVTSTHGVCFYQGKVILVDLETRGWGFPGGHMESGETPDECFQREVMEEAVVDGTSRMIGYILVDNRQDEFHDSSKYPEIGCQIYYVMDVDNVYHFNHDYEIRDRAMFKIEEVPNAHTGWNKIHDEILETAINQPTS